MQHSNIWFESINSKIQCRVCKIWEILRKRWRHLLFEETYYFEEKLVFWDECKRYFNLTALPLLQCKACLEQGNKTFLWAQNYQLIKAHDVFSANSENIKFLVPWINLHNWQYLDWLNYSNRHVLFWCISSVSFVLTVME